MLRWDTRSLLTRQQSSWSECYATTRPLTNCESSLTLRSTESNGGGAPDFWWLLQPVESVAAGMTVQHCPRYSAKLDQPMRAALTHMMTGQDVSPVEPHSDSSLRHLRDRVCACRDSTCGLRAAGGRSSLFLVSSHEDYSMRCMLTPIVLPGSPALQCRCGQRAYSDGHSSTRRACIPRAEPQCLPHHSTAIRSERLGLTFIGAPLHTHCCSAGASVPRCNEHMTCVRRSSHRGQREQGCLGAHRFDGRGCAQDPKHFSRSPVDRDGMHQPTWPSTVSGVLCARHCLVPLAHPARRIVFFMFAALTPVVRLFGLDFGMSCRRSVRSMRHCSVQRTAVKAARTRPQAMLTTTLVTLAAATTR